MANNYFEFKQFTIFQDLAAMKVGTDGVIMGAWTSVDNATHILDIGTGTGLIAIMCAQRNLSAQIDAVEIDASAYEQACINVNNCEWSDRIKTYNISLQQFSTAKRYDLIVTNPPFFANSTKAGFKEKSLARHNDSLSFCEIISFAFKHLSEKGILSVILPIVEGEIFISNALEKSLFCCRKTFVIPKPNAEAKRLLMEFCRNECETVVDELTSETDIRHVYTDEYKKLTGDFYSRMR